MRPLLALAPLALLMACASAPPGPETVSVALGPDAEAVAERECGGPARPETVSHESNVVIFRCLRTS